jgi:ABC-type multidrug transport system ATPase subunit
VLAGRKESGRITGEILINGNKPDITYTRYTAYVTQTDILFPTYTVGECVRFSAMCRLPEAVSAEEKTRFAEQILIDLDLKKIENKVVGMPGSGISPEQRKRLNLAVELAANPQLIFLDEVLFYILSNSYLISMLFSIELAFTLQIIYFSRTL